MAFERKAASLWHAFNALDDQTRHKVNKSQLKVLTHNIANSVGLETCITEILEALDTHKSQDSDITFIEYFFFLKTELFDRLRNSGDINANADLSKVDEICWFLCMRSYLKRDLKIITDDDAFKVFQVFNVHCEVDASGAVSYPVRCDQEEVGLFARRFCNIVGFEFDQEEYDKIAREIPLFNFQQMLVLLETQYCKTADNALISSALGEIHSEIIKGVIKKGFLSKKGQKITSIKERWFVLTPHRLGYYTASDERDQKGELTITNRSSVEAAADRSDKSGKCFKFVLHTDNRNLEMTATDLGTRSSWISAIKTAIEFCNKPVTQHQMSLAKRRAMREKKRAQEKEEEEKKKKEDEANKRTLELLQAEKEAKETAENLLKEAERRKLEEEERLRQEADAQKREYEEKLKQEQEGKEKAEADLRKQLEGKDEELKREMEDKERIRLEKEEYEKKLAEHNKLKEEQTNRIQELETLKQDLEKHLEEEIQAKKDEEIVRAAQSRVLKEEMEKREELEKLKEQMDQLLLDEAKKRIDLEEAKKEQEQVLLAEREKLMSLENERMEIEEKLRTAEDKMKEAAKAKAKAQENVEQKSNGLTKIKNKLKNIMGGDPKPPETHWGKGSCTDEELKIKQRLYSQRSRREEETSLLNTSQDDIVMTPVTPGETDAVFEEVSLE